MSIGIDKRKLTALTVCLVLGISVHAIAQQPTAPTDQKSEKQVIAWVQSAESDQDVHPPAELRVLSEDGKLRIVGSDGQSREIELDGARQIIINRNVQSTDQEGDAKIEVRGKAIVIDRDGKRHEIDLSGQPGAAQGGMLFVPRGEGSFEFKMAPQLAIPDNPLLPPMPGQMNVQLAQVSKYMIGVFSKPADDALRAQLDLPEGVGLVLEDVSEDSPAAKAGLQKYDLLISADGNELKSMSDLVKAVKEAGENDRAIQFQLVRRGKEMTIEVKPIERPGAEAAVGNWRGLIAPGRGVNLDVQELGPGIILDLDDDLSEELEQHLKAANENIQQTMKVQLQQMEQQMQQLQKQMQQLRKMTEQQEDK